MFIWALSAFYVHSRLFTLQHWTPAFIQAQTLYKPCFYLGNYSSLISYHFHPLKLSMLFLFKVNSWKFSKIYIIENKLLYNTGICTQHHWPILLKTKVCLQVHMVSYTFSLNHVINELWAIKLWKVKFCKIKANLLTVCAIWYNAVCYIHTYTDVRT